MLYLISFFLGIAFLVLEDNGRWKHATAKTLGVWFLCYWGNVMLALSESAWSWEKTIYGFMLFATTVAPILLAFQGLISTGIRAWVRKG